jgi:chorismate synthase
MSYVPQSSVKISSLTNHSGGIQGGISNGNDIVFRVAFKPIPSLARPQQTVNRAGEPIEIAVGGRHDVCALPRAVVLVEALAAMVTLDLFIASIPFQSLPLTPKV